MGIAFTDEQMRNWLKNECTATVDVKTFVYCETESGRRVDLILNFTPFPPEAIAWMKLREHSGSKNQLNQKSSCYNSIIMVPYYAGMRGRNALAEPIVCTSERFEYIHFPMRNSTADHTPFKTQDSTVSHHQRVAIQQHSSDGGGLSKHNKLRPAWTRLPIKAAEKGSYVFYSFFTTLDATDGMSWLNKCKLNYRDLVDTYSHKQFGIWLGLTMDFCEPLGGSGRRATYGVYSNKVRISGSTSQRGNFNFNTYYSDLEDLHKR